MKLAATLGILVLTIASVSFAADTQPSSMPAKVDPVMDGYNSASGRGDWAGAARVMRDAVTANPGNADYHNLYAYSLRKSGTSEMDLVFKHYNEALRLDPRHRGAHEYIGEAYLMVGNVSKAKEHLGALDKLCFFPCGEMNDLKKAISQYEAKSAK